MRKPKPGPDPVPWAFASLFEDVILGAVLYEIAANYTTYSEETKKKAEQNEDKLFSQAIDIAFDRISKLMKHSTDEFIKMQREFDQADDERQTSS